MLPCKAGVDQKRLRIIGIGLGVQRSTQQVDADHAAD